MTVRLSVDVVTLEPAPAVVPARRVDSRRLAQAIAEGIPRVRRTVTAAQVPTAGPPFVRYLSTGSRSGEDAFGQLRAWVEANAVRSANPWEWHWTAPHVAQPRIQIVWPVQRR